MTQKDKDLLLKDLCGRLPYGVKINVVYSNENASSFRQRVCIEGDNKLNTDIIGLYQCNEIDIKPYLFPLSSMTEEQKMEIKSVCDGTEIFDDGSWMSYISILSNFNFEINPAVAAVVDIYNKYHLDYRGLIPKDLAINATGLNIYE